MKTLWTCLIIVTASSLVLADKKEGKFSPGPASSFQAKQTNDKVTVAVSAYDTEELAHTAFGKLDPNQYGVLPVLVIIQNDTDQAMKLDHLEVEYTTVDGRHVEATPPYDVQTLGGGRRPSMPNGTPLPRIKHKSPLNSVEIDERSFAAKVLPPHDSASGFFYFQIEHRPGAKFYLSGIKVASTGKDILYFEVPLDYHR
jgi:hypothetical protein